MRHEARNFVHEHPAVIGWAVLGAFVAAWDAFAPETLSHGVDEALESHKWLTRAAVGYTAMHLLNMLPEQADGFVAIGKIARRV